MSFWLTCAGMLVVTFGSRISGLTLRMELPPFWLRFLQNEAKRTKSKNPQLLLFNLTNDSIP